jgi:hypothetical protein
LKFGYGDELDAPLADYAQLGRDVLVEVVVTDAERVRRLAEPQRQSGRTRRDGRCDAVGDQIELRRL